MASILPPEFVNLHVFIPPQDLQELREAYEGREWLWLVKRWNDLGMSTARLCPSCPDSIATVRNYLPKLWEEMTPTT